MKGSSWDYKLLSLTEVISLWSKDRSTKVGAIIVDNQNRILSTGYNGFPIDVNDNIDSRHERPTKYYYTEHAERNAIYSAAKNGIPLNGTTMYLLWKYPCADCARAIVQSGIKNIVAYNRDFPGKKMDWDIHFNAAIEILKEGGVISKFIDHE